MSNLEELEDHYQTLELKPGASRAEVERAYQSLSKKWDPTRCGNDKIRQRKAEIMTQELKDAYESICEELESTETAKAIPSSAPGAPARHWTQNWRYVWILGVILSLAYLFVDSYTRIQGIKATTGLMMVNMPLPERDLTSPTGYPGNQHVQVMPALGTDGYHWIMQTEMMLSGQEDIRVRHTDYDGPPGGRDVHWSSSLHWLVASLAFVDHLITHDPMIVSLERTMPWANTFVLGLMILLVPLVVARRFGSIPAALIALGFVTTYPYYEFSFVGYFDHHGLAASSDMLLILFAAAAGAGWLRNESIDESTLSPVQKALWRWLPNRKQAKGWMIASAIAGGTGLWISSASMVPAMFGFGVGALISTGFFARNLEKKPVGITDPTLWRLWGRAAACTSVFYYLLEYAPSHFTMRLEVNHPFYALACLGAGELLCQISLLIQRTSSKSEVVGPWLAGGLPRVMVTSKRLNEYSTWARIWPWLAVGLLPATVLLGGESVFVIRPGFLLNLHNDYILEFRTFFRQMGQLTPIQIVGGISTIPIIALPMVLILFTPELQRQLKAVLVLVAVPSFVMLGLAGMQIRWLGIACAICCAAVTIVAFVTTAPASAFDWKRGPRKFAAVLGLILIFVPFPIFSAIQWVANNWSQNLTELDLTQVVTRDVSERLRMRLGDERGVIISGPTTTTWMMYFGGFKGVGTLYWENLAGLRATAGIYSATNFEDAKKLIDENHVTHIAIYSWDPFAEEYARLGAGLRLPTGDFNQVMKETRAQDDRLSQAFVLKLLTQHLLPNWLLPLPYRMPDHQMLKSAYVLLLEVVPEQTNIEHQLRLAQWMMMQASDAAGTANAETSLQQILQVKPDYLPALIAEARLEQFCHNDDKLRLVLPMIKMHMDSANTLAFEDKVDLSILLFETGEVPAAIEQANAVFQMADERGMRRLQPDRLQALLVLAVRANINPLPATFKLGLSLLQPNMRAQVLFEQANALSRAGDEAKAAQTYREVIKLIPDSGSALAGLGMILATSPNAALRNGAEAVDLAQKAIKANHYEDAGTLELLAFANAEAGHYDDAVFYVRQAQSFLRNTNQTAEAEALEDKIKLFQNHQAFHQP